MARKPEDIIDELMEREAGYVNNPADKGGPTKFGITAKTLGGWRHLGRDATADEVATLDSTEARTILLQQYIVAPGFMRVPDDALQTLLVDMWVNHGPHRATLIIQAALKMPGDGILGPQTLRRLTGDKNLYINDYKPLFDSILAERIRFYGRDISHDHSQAEFAAGWLDRAADFLSPN